ncbi:MAG: SLBB domain-containing protein, partial [Solirubrobacteraceae bacterium]
MPAVTRPQLVAYALATLVVLALGVRFMQGQARSAAVATPADAGESAQTSGSASASVRIEPRPSAVALVHVAGAVRSPGVYRLRGGQRIQDAVHRAGGPRPGADLNAINLAAKVADGQQVVVPRRG